jgi:hypothetical protein
MDATGVAALTPTGELHIEKADLPATNFNWWRKELPETVRSVLLHTRYATQGSPMNLENNHPIRYNNAIVIHNGHIGNDDDIFQKHSFARNAQVDSECIAALVDKHGIDKANLALKELDGNYAVALADLRNPNTLVLAKGWSSPLYYYETDVGIVWASTEKTIVDAFKLALNLDIKTRDINQLFFGKLLLIENGEVEHYSFEPFDRRPTYTYFPAKKKETEYSPGPIDVVNGRAKKDTNGNYEWLPNWTRNWFGGKKKEEEKTEPYNTDKKHIEFWRNEPHEIAYSVKTAAGNEFIFKACDGCENAYQTTLLNLTEQGFILCNKCLGEFDAEEPLEQNNPAIVHEVIIDLIAEKYETSPDFVEWLLFESDDDEINHADSSLVSLYLQFNEDYDKMHTELTGGQFGSAEHLAAIATEALEEEETAIAEGAEEICGVEAFATEEYPSWFQGVI